MDRIMKEYGVSPEETLSIGDRYDVDAKPMLELGGRAVVLRKPRMIEKFLDDIDDPKSCEEYFYYK